MTPIPQDERIERAAIGVLLYEPDRAQERLAALHADMFNSIAVREVFNAVRSIVRDGHVPDTATVLSAIQKEGSKYLPALTEIVSATPDEGSPTAFETYVATLQDMDGKRKLLQVALKAQEIAQDRSPLNGQLEDFAALTTSLMRRGHTKERLTVRTPAEIRAMQFSNADNILGDRVLAEGQSLVICGAGGIGKSRLLLQLGAAVTTGRDFVSLHTHAQEKRWLIIQVENSNRRLHADLEGIKLWLGTDDNAKFDERVWIHTVENDLDAILTLDDQATHSRIAEIVSEFSPDVVAWDSLYNFASGDLNKDQDMRTVLGHISHLSRQGNPNRSIVVLHHALTGKAAASRATGYDRSSFGRNSKVLHSWARGQINVAPGSGESNDRLVLTCGKCSNGREFEPFAAVLDTRTMVYRHDPDFDFKSWQEDVSGKDSGPRITNDGVAELMRTPMAKVELTKAVMAQTGCSRQSAYRIVDRATGKTIKEAKDGTYHRK